MKRRVIGVFIALIMALAGTALVASLVKSAEARALAGEELVDVLVVTDDIAAGMTVEEIQERVAIEQVPAKVRASDALQSRYVLAARARGVSRTKLIGRHALPNALVPTVTVIG